MRIKENNSKHQTTNNLVKKRRKRRNLRGLNITIRDRNGSLSTYPVSIASVKVGAKGYFIPVPTKKKQKYEIISPIKRKFTSNELINKKIILFNGEKRIEGKVVKIGIASNGAVYNTASKGGIGTPPQPLPPNDETKGN